MNRSVQPEWCTALPLQQQSVLMLATRGPDGIAKDHPCKAIQRAYRGTVLIAARYGRALDWGEDSEGDDFMSLATFSHISSWEVAMERFYHTVDSLPHHYILHLLHGAEILGYHHPEHRFSNRWYAFYWMGVHSLHLNLEREGEMDTRLSDWNRKEWK